MANGDLNIALVLKLVDQITGPHRAAINAVRDIGRVTEQTGRAGVAWSNQQLDANRARRSALMGEAMGVAATGAALVAALAPAVKFESSMSGVRKVIDFETPDGFANMSRDILELTTSGALPMAAEGIAEIIEAAGQAGVVDKALPDDEERAQLIAFATDAAKMGVAFDMAAADAGSAMAMWRKAMGMSQEEALDLGDAINFLSNNMNASAPNIVDIVRRQGAVAMAAGLATNEIAALSAAFLSGGASPEIAATGLKNFLGALTDGEAMTAKQSAVMKTLGFDATELAKRMQVDAKGAIVDVMEALAELPAHAQGAALSQLFGEESKGAIAPLLTNVELLREAFGLVGDPTQYAGSMLAEYATQAETTANALILTQNFMKGLSIAVGSILLPELNELLLTVQPLIKMITDWAAAHPELVTMVFRVVLALGAMKAASIALRWGIFTALTPILHLIRAGSWLLVLLPRLVGGLLALLNPMKLVRASIIALKWAVISTGIGALLVGIAMAGVWIYNNWAGLGEFFKGFWQGFKDALGPAAPMLEGVIAYAREIWTWFTNILGPMDASKEAWRALGVDAGGALGGIAGKVAEWTGANGSLIGTLLKVYGAFLALRLIWRLPMSPIRAAGRLIAWIAKGPILWLMRGVGLLGKAFLRLGVFMLTNPIGLTIMAVAALAYLVYRAWDRITAWIKEKVAAVKAAFDEGIIQGVFKLISEFNPWTLAMEGAQILIAEIMELVGVPQNIVDAFREFSLYDTGVSLLQGLWDGMASLVGPMVDAISASLSAIIPAWMKSAWNWVVGGGDPSETPPGRDVGGAVRAGLPYVVGERGREVFVPGVSGSILPGRVLKAAMAAGAIAAPAAAMPSQEDIIDRVDRRPALSMPAAAPVVQRQGDTITIAIHPAPGQDPQAIARAVAAELQRRDDARRGDLHDGGDY